MGRPTSRSVLAAALASFALAALPACAAVEPTDHDGIGDPCRSPSSFCYDDASEQRCEDHAWAVASCETVCAERGPAWVANGCDEVCGCVLANPKGCTPGETACADEDSVSVCSEQQTPVSVALADVTRLEARRSDGAYCLAGARR